MKPYQYTILALLLVSCIPVSAITYIESNKVDNYDFKSQKIFIVAYENESSEKVMRLISSEISELLKTYKIENMLHNEVVSDLDFEPKFPQDKITEYKPDTILLMAFDRGEFLNGDLTMFEMQSSLIDPIEGRIIWKSELQSDKTIGIGGLDSQNIIEEMAFKFILKMYDDGLLDISKRPTQANYNGY